MVEDLVIITNIVLKVCTIFLVLDKSILHTNLFRNDENNIRYSNSRVIEKGNLRYNTLLKF